MDNLLRKNLKAYSLALALLPAAYGKAAEDRIPSKFVEFHQAITTNTSSKEILVTPILVNGKENANLETIDEFKYMEKNAANIRQKLINESALLTKVCYRMLGHLYQIEGKNKFNTIALASTFTLLDSVSVAAIDGATIALMNHYSKDIEKTADFLVSDDMEDFLDYLDGFVSELAENAPQYMKDAINKHKIYLNKRLESSVYHDVLRTSDKWENNEDRSIPFLSIWDANQTNFYKTLSKSFKNRLVDICEKFLSVTGDESNVYLYSDLISLALINQTYLEFFEFLRNNLSSPRSIEHLSLEQISEKQDLSWGNQTWLRSNLSEIGSIEETGAIESSAGDLEDNSIHLIALMWTNLFDDCFLEADNGEVKQISESLKTYLEGLLPEDGLLSVLLNKIQKRN